MIMCRKSGTGGTEYNLFKAPLFESFEFKGTLRLQVTVTGPESQYIHVLFLFLFFGRGGPGSKWTEISVTTTGDSSVNEKSFVHRNKRKACLELLFKHIARLRIAYTVEKSGDKHLYRIGDVLPDSHFL